MSKIVVYSMAYRGDVYPYVPIATELARRGHDVTYVVPAEFHAQMADEPFAVADSGSDFGPTALDEHAAYIDRWGTRMGGAMLLRLFYGTMTIPHLPAMFDALAKVAADADLIISHPAAASVGSMVSEVHGVPMLVGDLFPMLLPSVHAPVAGMPYLGPRVNRMMISASRSRLTDPMTSAHRFRAFRRELGLDADGWNVIDGRLSPSANLALVPTSYVPAQPDWPTGYRSVGFTTWDGPAGGRLDDELAAFARDQHPVVVTLGTSAATARPEVFDAALEALDRRSVPVVVLTSTEAIAGSLRELAGDRHLVRPFAPLGPLLRSARAIVHSGAHGTNALALTHGVPSVVVPCLFDQVFHARRQEELGTGCWSRRPRQLAAAIDRVLDEPALGRRAAAYAAEIAEEDGTSAVADEAERLIST